MNSTCPYNSYFKLLVWPLMITNDNKFICIFMPSIIINIRNIIIKSFMLLIYMYYLHDTFFLIDWIEIHMLFIKMLIFQTIGAMLLVMLFPLILILFLFLSIFFLLFAFLFFFTLVMSNTLSICSSKVFFIILLNLNIHSLFIVR